MKIGILFGGNSLEHEISIISAFQLKKKLESEYDLCMIYIDNESNIYDASKTTLDDFKYNKKNKMKKSSFVLGGIKNTELDCMVLCMHGENGEDGIAAALMRFYKIKYVGSDLFASSICMDKYLTYMYLANCGIKMIDSYIYTYNDYLSGDSILEYPSIVKPLTGGSSIGIYVINPKSELVGLLRTLDQKFGVRINFMVYVNQIIMLYTLNLFSVVCQLYLNKTGRKKKKCYH